VEPVLRGGRPGGVDARRQAGFRVCVQGLGSMVEWVEEGTQVRS
jgi:hypothetical protein